GALLTTTSAPSSPVYRDGVAFDPDTGAMYISDSAPTSTSIAAKGLAVTSGRALHVNSSGSGFASDGRISITTSEEVLPEPTYIDSYGSTPSESNSSATISVPQVEEETLVIAM